METNIVEKFKEKYGTKATYPFSKDPNTEAQMFESDAILEYLFFTYGDGTIPWMLLVPLLKNNNNPIVTA
jgi:glutathione S-transferase